MLKRTLFSLVVIIIGLILYFIAWPVPIDPVVWIAPPNPGYTRPFEVNSSKVANEASTT